MRPSRRSCCSTNSIPQFRCMWKSERCLRRNSASGCCRFRCAAAMNIPKPWPRKISGGSQGGCGMRGKFVHWLKQLLKITAVLAILAALALLATVPLGWKDQAMLGALLFASLLVGHYRWRGPRATMVMIGLSTVCTARYVWYRLSETAKHVATNGSQMTAVDAGAMLLLLAAEAYAFSVMLLGYFQSIRPLGRKPEPLPEDTSLWHTVDVMIPTYNEPLDVIRPTVLAAMRIDWPADRMRVYVLDDGRRAEVQEFAEECGAGYITRRNNQNAKAGNINNALHQTSGEFVAIFDSDHIA